MPSLSSSKPEAHISPTRHAAQNATRLRSPGRAAATNSASLGNGRSSGTTARGGGDGSGGGHARHSSKTRGHGAGGASHSVGKPAAGHHVQQPPSALTSTPRARRDVLQR